MEQNNKQLNKNGSRWNKQKIDSHQKINLSKKCQILQCLTNNKWKYMQVIKNKFGMLLKLKSVISLWFTLLYIYLKNTLSISSENTLKMVMIEYNSELY